MRIFHFYCLCILLWELQAITFNIPSIEYHALLDIYNHLHGNSWKWKAKVLYGNPWNVTKVNANPCTDRWQGITCTTNCQVPCNVQEIILYKRNLVGSIPQTIANFTKLNYLDFTGNNITGRIPNVLGSLKLLNTLYLDDNNFVGTIPSTFGKLIHLTAIGLSKNYLQGTIPPELQSLKALQSLQFSTNYLEGTIPKELFHLSNLTHFQVSDNQLCGSLSNDVKFLKSMTIFVVYSNQLTGSIPSGFGDLKQLTNLDLDTNRFTGSIPSSLTTLPKLQTLYLYSNMLNGTLPNNFTGLISLQQIYLNYNKISGTIPTSLHTLSNLQIFHCCYNRLTGTLPPELGSLSHLLGFIACYNELNGTFPESYALGMTSMVMFILTGNQFTGTIPNTIDHMKIMQYFYLYNNGFTGQIPCSLGNITHLQYLDIYNNHFSGTICSSWGQLHNLSMFSISFNHIQGTLPSDMYTHFTKVEQFYVNNNELGGTIPNTIGESLSSVVEIDFNLNHFHGTIPNSLGNLINLQYFTMQGNFLTGTIPASLGNLIHVQYFDLYVNLLEGTIPETFSNMTSLIEFLVYTNRLTGTFPTAMFLLPNLSSIAIYDNQLSGTFFTQELCEYSSLNLNVVDIFENQFTGTIPPYCLLPNLQYIFIQKNYFTGSLSGIQTWKSLYGMNFSSNYITGALFGPMIVTPMTSLTSLSTTQQQSIYHHTNSVPSINSYFLSLTQLLSLDLSANLLTETVNNIFIHIPNLELLILTSNGFTGNLHNITHPVHHMQANITVIDISDNAITGTIPPSIFKPTLTTFAAVKNCITGSIPTELCNFHALETIAMDGLHTAEECQLRFFPSYSVASYELLHSIEGGIPSCLFNMPSLQTLHLSGNGLTGSLPDNMQISDTFTSLSLSYNKLTGTIPLEIQKNLWLELDLSYNKFSGTLSSFPISNNNDWSLYLSVNRLSGSIPSSLYDVTTIDILKGNLFDCDQNILLEPEGKHDTSLPVHDVHIDTYTCATDSINNALYVWCSLFVFCFGLLIALLWIGKYDYQHYVGKGRETFLWCKEVTIRLLDYWSVSTNLALDMQEQDVTMNLYVLGKNMQLLRQLSQYFTLFVVGVLIPTYAILSTTCGTHSFSYAWTISVAYLSGLIPAVVLLILMVLFYFFFTERCRHAIIECKRIYLHSKETMKLFSKDDETNDMPHRLAMAIMTRTSIMIAEEIDTMRVWLTVNWQYALLGFVLLAINITVVLAVNIAYVYATTLGLSMLRMLFITIAISVFKIMWMHTVVLYLFAKLLSAYDTQKRVQLAKKEQRSQQRKQFNPSLFSVDEFARPSTIHDINASTPSSQFTDSIANTPIPLRARRRSTMKDKDENTIDSIQRVYILSCIVIFNTIVAPFLANIFIDPNCFYNVIHTPESVAVTYSLQECLVYSVSVGDIVCMDTFTNYRGVSYLPPFQYSYQCSSSLLNDFVTVFIYRYLLSAFVFPVISIFWKLLQEKEYYHNWESQAIAWLMSGWTNDQSIVATRRNTKPIIIKHDENRIHEKPYSQEIELGAMEKSEGLKNETMSKSEESFQMNPMISGSNIDGADKLHSFKRSLERHRSVTSESKHERRSRKFSVDVRNSESFLMHYNEDHASIEGFEIKEFHQRSSTAQTLISSLTDELLKYRVFNKESYVISYVGDIAVLITFGWAFPPLAVLVCFSIYVTSLVRQLWLGRYVVLYMRYPKSLTDFQSDLFYHYLHVMNDNCGDLMTLFQPLLPLLASLSSSFIAFFLFDILGDNVGTLQAVWILIMTSTMPLWITALKYIFRQIHKIVIKVNDEEKVDKEITTENAEDGHLPTTATDIK